ncbi:MAG TPA: hypothetical protein PKC67_00620 [Kiritimatiellia bacterium]|nr:hypothetical protein [Kiritimatiellia bacterium]HMP32824.1 hypothetical protein [Kiritimatiellia bacterium]
MDLTDQVKPSITRPQRVANSCILDSYDNYLADPIALLTIAVFPANIVQRFYG